MEIDNHCCIIMSIIKIDKIEELIINIRNEKVIIDSDIAIIYNVKTKEVNQAVSNNLEKFPSGYIIELTKEEKNDVVKNFDHLEKLKYSPHLPKAFSEKGLYMLATILKSKRATEATIAIIETFAKLRTLSGVMKKLSITKKKEEQQSLMDKTGELMGDLIYSDLETTESETSIELNFAVLKLKHTIKRNK